MVSFLATALGGLLAFYHGSAGFASRETAWAGRCICMRCDFIGVYDAQLFPTHYSHIHY